MKRLFYLAALLLLISCGGTGGRPPREPAKTEVPSSRDMVTTPSDSGVVRMNLTGGSGELLVRKVSRQTIYVHFENRGYRKLSAEVIPVVDSVANLRISQLILPDGTMDGPFGRKLEYGLPTDGEVQLVIGESLMQGDPWQGDFRVRVRLTQ